MNSGPCERGTYSRTDRLNHRPSLKPCHEPCFRVSWRVPGAGAILHPLLRELRDDGRQLLNPAQQGLLGSFIPAILAPPPLGVVATPEDKKHPTTWTTPQTGQAQESIMLTSLLILSATTMHRGPLIQLLCPAHFGNFLEGLRSRCLAMLLRAVLLRETPCTLCRYLLLTAACSRVSPAVSWPGCPAPCPYPHPCPRPELPRAPLAPSSRPET